MFQRILHMIAGRAPMTARPRRRGFAPRLEQLEAREMMSATSLSTIDGSTIHHFASDVASSRNGDFVTAYTSRISSTDNDIKVKLTRGTGETRFISVVSSPKNEHDPVVAMAANGDFVVAWVEDYSATDQDIKMQRYSADGSRRGSEVRVNSSSNKEFDPSIAMDDAGNIVVSYTQRFGDYDRNVLADMFAANGTYTSPGGRPIAVDTFSHHSSVTRQGNGRFVIAYVENSYGGGPYGEILVCGIRMADYTADGVRTNGRLVAGPYGIQALHSDSNNTSRPSVSINDAGNVALTYHNIKDDGTFQVVAGVLSSNLDNFRYRTFDIGSDTFQDSDISLDPTQDRFVVAFQHGPQNSTSRVKIREFAFGAASLTLTGTTNMAEGTFNPAVAVSGNHKYLTTVDRRLSTRSDFDIMGQFGVLPALTLDGTTLTITGDNGVNKVSVIQDDIAGTFTILRGDGMDPWVTSLGLTNIKASLQGGDDEFVYRVQGSTLQRPVPAGTLSRSLDLNVLLGTGNDKVTVNVGNIAYGATLGISLGAEGAGIGTSTANVLLPNANIVDAVFGNVDGRLTFSANLGAGNDTIHAAVGAVVNTGHVEFSLQGNEAIPVFGGSAPVPMIVDGDDTYHVDFAGGIDLWSLVRVAMSGGAGNDDLQVRYHASSPARLRGVFETTLDGGSGNDTLTADVWCDSGSTGVARIAIYGRAGNDTVNLAVQSEGAENLGGYALLDGGGQDKDALLLTAADIDDLDYLNFGYLYLWAI